VKPIGGCELACEERSERRDLKLGDGEIKSDGLSRVST
jgi:hypothetical protein